MYIYCSFIHTDKGCQQLIGEGIDAERMHIIGCNYQNKSRNLYDWII